jgi:hypothetical protein
MPKIIKSAKGSFTTADITVDSSGRVITASTGSAGGTFISATGGTIHTIGDYKVHQFNSDATFTVTSVGSGSPESAIVDYIVVGGGGGGGSGGGGNGGGGGGGGYRSSGQFRVDQGNAASTGITVSASPGSYPITVGAGGSGGTNPGGSGGSGSASTFSTITSLGGGGGGGNSAAPTGNFGSGGGGGRLPPGADGPGNNPPVSPPMGYDGGLNGGGGALGKGSLAGPGGGMGVGSFILNKSEPQNPGVTVNTLYGLYLANGGANSTSASASVGPVGGYGGDPGPGMVNTGAGTPGSTSSDCADAGSGVVYIRYRFQ